ncbi:MAG: methionine adenosyltransferase [Chloroflexi bacterium]|nr:methionine adenosyltransferase [Chloroflexota bacterium]
MKRDYLFTSESVSEGHPDKMCDRISDAILDAVLAQDPLSRVACETLIARNNIFIAGEITSKAKIDYAETAKKALREVSERPNLNWFNEKNCIIQTNIAHQSSNISNAVDCCEELGAGDQGMMFGYACNETAEYMPLAIYLAHRLMEKHAQVRKNGLLPWLGPDAKAQVTVRYQNHTPVSVEKVLISTQHEENIDNKTIYNKVKEYIIETVIPNELRGADIEYLINPSGLFVLGGPVADTGLTGRKIIVDTYGGSCPHGGGAFSGKDPTKVDRSAAYMARYMAKNIVAAGLASRVTIQLSYAIGIPQPTSLMINTHGTGIYSDSEIEKAVRVVFPLTPKGIIDSLDLRKPIYKNTASYGHFGRKGFSWEKTDCTEILKQALTASGA